MSVDVSRPLERWTYHVDSPQAFIESVLNRKVPLDEEALSGAQREALSDVEKELDKVRDQEEFVYQDLFRLEGIEKFIQSFSYLDGPSAALKCVTLKKIQAMIDSLNKKAACFPSCLRANPIPSLIAEYLPSPEQRQLSEIAEVARNLFVINPERIFSEICTDYTCYELEEFSLQNPTSQKNIQLMVPLIHQLFMKAAPVSQIQFFETMDKHFAGSQDKANFWLEVLHSLPEQMHSLAMPVWEDLWHSRAWRTGHVQQALKRLVHLTSLEIHAKGDLVSILWNHKAARLEELKITYSPESNLIDALIKNDFLSRLKRLTLAGNIPIANLFSIINGLSASGLEELWLNVADLDDAVLQEIKSHPKMQKTKVARVPEEL